MENLKLTISFPIKRSYCSQSKWHLQREIMHMFSCGEYLRIASQIFSQIFKNSFHSFLIVIYIYQLT